jgi:hypothetical protein
METGSLPLYIFGNCRVFIIFFWQGLKRKKEKKSENLEVRNILAGSHSEHRWRCFTRGDSPRESWTKVDVQYSQKMLFRHNRRRCDRDKMAVGVRRDFVVLSSFPSPQSQRMFAIFCVCFGGSENLESWVTVLCWVGKTKTYGIRGVLQFHESEGLA